MPKKINNGELPMKIIQKLACVCICIFSFVFANASGDTNSNLKPRDIHVLIEKDTTEALLEVSGPYYIFNPQDGARVASGLLGKRFMVRPIEVGIKWGEEFPGIHQIIVVPRSNDCKILINGIQYDGAIAVFKVENKLNIVNHLDVESYLKSILNVRFELPLEPEAMAAIAIAARTTAYSQILTNLSSFWHVDGNSVKYQGSALVIPDSASSRAVDSTKNLILVNSKNSQTLPFAAPWTEHSGGKTAPFQAIFRKDMNAPDQGVEAPIAALDRKDSRWSYSISIDSFCTLFNLKKVSSIDTFQDNFSNKVYALRVKEGDKYIDIDFFTLQAALGKKFIKSNDFKVSTKDNEVHFVGYGKGHGVGLCLYSASCMAQNGDIAIKILSKFFPNTHLLNLSAESSVKKF
jgi:stage II sporulation protein D